MQAFDVYFVGETLPGTDPNDVRRRVAALFKVRGDAVERLFSGNPVRVKQAVDVDAASRYRGLFRDAGALVQIVPSGDPPPAGRRADRPSTTASAGSQAAMSLAEPGAIIDPTPSPPPAQIDTSGLSALPANSGSLEDCRSDPEPQPIPDISHLRIVDS